MSDSVPSASEGQSENQQPEDTSRVKKGRLDEAVRHPVSGHTPMTISDDPSEVAWCLNGEAISLIEKYEAQNELSVLDTSISLFRSANEVTLEEHDIYLTNLGNSLRTRFEHLGELPDIDTAIFCHQKALDLTSDKDADKADCLSNLGSSLRTRFERLGELPDLDKGLQCQRDAVRLTPEGHAEKPSYLNSLGHSLMTRFKRFDKLTDIDEAIACFQNAVNLDPERHANKPNHLANLGNALVTRFERLGELSDLDKAITNLDNAVYFTAQEHADRPSYLDNLCYSLSIRFEHLGQLPDIDKAIRYQEDAVKLTPEECDEKSKYLIHLSDYLQLRFERLGEPPDIDKAISCDQNAVNLTLEGHADRPPNLSHLSSSLLTRFWLLRERPDIDKAIACRQIALNLIPEGHSNRPHYLNILGDSLRTRFEHLGEFPDIDKAIAYQEAAVKLIPEGHSVEPNQLNDLGNCLLARFERLGELPDIDKGIVYHQDAVHSTPEGSADRSRHLNDLGHSLRARFERLGELPDINNAIACHQNAVELCPERHYRRPHRLYGLGYAYQIKFSHLSEQMDYGLAVEAYRSIGKNQLSDPSTLFSVALSWMRLSSDVNDVEFALEATEWLLELIPRVVWLGQKVHHRLEVLSEFRDAFNEAAALAIKTGNFAIALECLDEGRSIVWGQLLRLRTPISELRLKNAVLADDLERIAQALEVAGNSVETTVAQDYESSITNTNMEEDAQKHHELAWLYECRIKAVRKLEGFENFLLPKRLEELKAAAENNPVVIVNVHEIRCDAIILHRNGSLSHVRLGGFSYENATDMQDTLRSCLNVELSRGRGQGRSRVSTQGQISRILDHLWSGIVEPVMQKLKGKDELNNGSDGAIPRITWCTTGPLTFLPLHAAAANASRKSHCEPIVSSYTPSLSALLQRQDPANASSLHSIPKVLAVSQPYAAGFSPIPATRQEIEAVQKSFEVTWIDQEEANIETVSREMERHDVVHLACHGIQDDEEPTKSAFILADGRLTLQKLMGMNLKDAQLAVLSACQTATGDETRPEEAMHLTAGMLSAGFRSVVGTMWSIQDDDAPIVTEAFYAKLREFAKDGRSDWRLKTAYALHYAVQVLRDKIGDDEYVRWAPFVHFGM